MWWHGVECHVLWIYGIVCYGMVGAAPYDMILCGMCCVWCCVVLYSLVSWSIVLVCVVGVVVYGMGLMLC